MQYFHIKEIIIWELRENIKNYSLWRKVKRMSKEIRWNYFDIKKQNEKEKKLHPTKAVIHWKMHFEKKWWKES